MKLWIDDVRPAPEGYLWAKSVNEAKNIITEYKDFCTEIESFYYDQEVFNPEDELNIDHDAGEYAKDGGDYIKLLDWLEEKEYNFPIHIHSQNPVGVENIRRIIKRNGWEEI